MFVRGSCVRLRIELRPREHQVMIDRSENKRNNQRPSSSGYGCTMMRQRS